MSGPASRNPFTLSYKVFRNGTSSFQNLTTEEAARNLNKVGHCCLNVFATTALFIAVLFCNYNRVYTPSILYVLYALTMWLQLATVRYRNFISLMCTVATELSIFGLVLYSIICFFVNPNESGASTPVIAGIEIRDYVFPFIYLIVTVIRFVYLFILYKVLTFKNPHFTMSTTVFLKPTNTPVTFSSVLAPQELDPTNPYYPQTVYNNNQPQVNLLDKSLT